MNKSDLRRNYPMLHGRFLKKGYDWWWHNFTAVNAKTGQEKAFFIEFFTVNPARKNDNKSNGEVPILGQLKENQEKGLKPSYLMLKCGWWGKDACQLHRFFAWNDVKLKHDKKGFSILAKDCFCSESQLKGSVELSEEEVKNHPEYMSNAGSMSFDLKVDKKIAFNVGYGAGNLFRFLTAFEMYWHAEGMKSLFSGKIIANGQEYIVKEDSSFGYADKNWGADFTSPWVWLSSNDLVSLKTGKRLENSVFDIGGGRPKAFGIAMNRQLLSDYYYEGKSYEFNFSKFWTGCKTKFDSQESQDEITWYVRQETHKYVMESNFACKKEDMLLINYEAPDGKKRHNKLWNGGNGYGRVKLYKKQGKNLQLIDEVEARHVGCEYGEYDK
ncbi:MAG: hypothetical protein K5866_04615 [Treponema sp.]|nr:hypothetical protein [Treponema sp.]